MQNAFSRRALLAGLPLFASLRAAGAPSPTGLKITKFVLHKATLRWRGLLFLEIHTDGGLIGVGDGSLHTRCTVVEEALRWLEPHLKGLDPAGVEQHWNRVYYGLTRWRGGPVLGTALSAVDLALSDLEGKRLGVPVWRLLGGSLRPGSRVYYSHWDRTAKDPSPAGMAARAQETVAKGWTAVKWSIPQAPTEAERIESTVRRLEAIRKAVGDKLDIGLELWESFTVRSAIQFAQAVSPYKPLFIEEPVQRENPLAFTEVAAKSPVPVATGEGLLNRYEFRQLLEAKGAAIIQPDVLHCGGITELRKIANLAETFGVEVAPHQSSGPLGFVASLTAMSVCRNFLIQEWEADDDTVFQELTGGSYPVQKGGLVHLPDAPGLGLNVDFAGFTRRFPYTTG
jgi:galactonate dehydratase